MQFLGLQMLTWHDLVVEFHTGVALFVAIALVLRILVDIAARGEEPSGRVRAIRAGTDFVAYAGAVSATVFLFMSAVTGYLLQPYTTLIGDPLLLNKAFTALGALAFWLAFALLRFLAGPGLWQRRGLYALAMLTAFVAFLFTTVAGSLGAQLSIGQSVMDPLYQALSINFRAQTMPPLAVGLTAVVLVLGIIVVTLWKPSRKSPG